MSRHTFAVVRLRLGLVRDLLVVRLRFGLGCLGHQALCQSGQIRAVCVAAEVNGELGELAALIGVDDKHVGDERLLEVTLIVVKFVELREC